MEPNEPAILNINMSNMSCSIQEPLHSLIKSPSTVADNYGVYCYGVYLFLMTIWWGQSWGTATACPYSLLEEYVEEGTNPVHVVLKIFAQVLGGLASFR